MIHDVLLRCMHIINNSKNIHITVHIKEMNSGTSKNTIWLLDNPKYQLLFLVLHSTQKNPNNGNSAQSHKETSLLNQELLVQFHKK